jgi:hypothetical protein
MLNRRQFLATGIAAVGGLGGLATWRFIHSSDENAIIAVLRKRLDYLLLDEEGLHAFAKDLLAQEVISRNKLRLLDFTGVIYTRLPMISSNRNALTHAIRHGEERVVSLYLLSSDFFLTGLDESKPVRYYGYYDPMQRPRPCAHPFARPIML